MKTAPAETENFSHILYKASVFSPKIQSIVQNPNHVQYAKLMRILPRVASFYEDFDNDVRLNDFPRIHHRNLFSREFINKYFSIEVLLRLRDDKLEEEILNMENLSRHIRTNPAGQPRTNLDKRNFIPTTHFIYALHRAGLEQSDIASFFHNPANAQQTPFILNDTLQFQFTDLIFNFCENSPQGLQDLFALLLDLDNNNLSGNFRAVFEGLGAFERFDFLKTHLELFTKVLTRESSNNIRAFIPYLSIVNNTTLNYLDQEILLESIFRIIKSGRPEKLSALIGEPLKFMQLLRDVLYDFQAFEARFNQIPTHRTGLLRTAIRELDYDSFNWLLSGRRFSFQEVLNLPDETSLSALKLLKTFYKYTNTGNRPLPAFIRKFLIYDHNNQTPGYKANFIRNLEHLNLTILSIALLFKSTIINLANFDDCMQMMGLTFDDIVNIQLNQPEKFTFLISFIEHLSSLDTETEKENFIRDYAFLFNRFVKRVSGTEYSLSEAMFNHNNTDPDTSDFRIPFRCLCNTRSPFKGIEISENESKESQLLQLQILEALSSLPLNIQHSFGEFQDLTPDNNNLNSIARNIKFICETYFPSFQEIQKQIGFQRLTLFIIKELKQSARGIQIISLPKIPNFGQFLKINNYFRPFSDSHDIFALITPRLLFTDKCERALFTLETTLRGDGGDLRDFILRFEEANVQGSIADFIRTIITSPECLNEIVRALDQYALRNRQGIAVKDGINDLQTSLGFNERDVLFIRFEEIHNSFITTSSMQEALEAIANSANFWTEGDNIGGEKEYSEDDMKQRRFVHPLAMLSKHRLSNNNNNNMALVPQPINLREKASSVSDHRIYNLISILNKQDIMERLNDLKKDEKNQAPYNELLQALVKLITRFELNSELATFWENDIQGLEVNVQIKKLVELSRTEIEAKVTGGLELDCAAMVNEPVNTKST